MKNLSEKQGPSGGDLFPIMMANAPLVGNSDYRVTGNAPRHRVLQAAVPCPCRWNVCGYCGCFNYVAKAKADFSATIR